jgi:hypothetical protein
MKPSSKGIIYQEDRAHGVSFGAYVCYLIGNESDVLYSIVFAGHWNHREGSLDSWNASLCPPTCSLLTLRFCAASLVDLYTLSGVCVEAALDEAFNCRRGGLL